MNSTLTYKCPNCGGALTFDAELQRSRCDFCLSTFTDDELSDTRAQKIFEEQDREDRAFAEELNEYRCQSCGAEIVTDKSTVASFCYYCHNPVVLLERVTGVHKPSKIIPFRFDKDEAKSVFLRYAKKKWFLPKDYFSPEQSDKITGVYYPFWVVDSDASALFTATGRKIKTWRVGDYRYTETSQFAVKRGGEIHFEDITASALSTEDKNMLEGILPYEMNEHIDFSIPYLQGFQAKKKDLSRDALSAEIRRRMNRYSEQLLSDTVRGYHSVTDKRTDITLRNSHWEYTLMPIWILNYKRRGKNYTYAMNGSTGKIYGELPISVPKLSILGAVTAAVVGILSFLIGWGMFL